jgi:hypothetical protein
MEKLEKGNNIFNGFLINTSKTIFKKVFVQLIQIKVIRLFF